MDGELFSRNKHTESELVHATISILTRPMNIVVLYGIGHETEKKLCINQTSLLFYQRSVIEKINRIKRQIKRITLRRLHEHYRFELYVILLLIIKSYMGFVPELEFEKKNLIKLIHYSL
ncbi:Gustatory receptor [Aphis craccivora]|uniref:Gustatory receptor n=1 Tax=Aphis craccivora TaxID=307492 RepID=A0A6G0YXC7_APHCR|nr:Gustatory receptor [Aphis craccivora]